MVRYSDVRKKPPQLGVEQPVPVKSKGKGEILLTAPLAEVNVVAIKGRGRVYTRAKLVGKFPGIKHRPAPAAERRLSDEDRRLLIAAMALT